ncbi:MAG: methylated-DNA--[protein]-cysteine S-methyltransferase [Myxococcales bacterium]|nr:methylated-DNA--[protein]-cysteine S-methyltransferase [Myxococcales bacterium]
MNHATPVSTPSPNKRVSPYETIASVIAAIDRSSAHQPSLGELAADVGVSREHLQRTFRQWAGISPKRFLQACTLTAAQGLLRADHSVLDASFSAGLSGPGRLHDLMVAATAVTPGEFKSRGKGLHITYGWHDTPFGRSLIAQTARGVVALYFEAEGTENLSRLQREWSGAQITESPAVTAPVAAQIFDAPQPGKPIPLLLRGTNLQLQVWRALLRIPEGSAVSYSHVAQTIDQPRAVRAVASAVGRNPISYLIPCHRVLRKSGAIGGYHWGLPRKRVMLALEAARTLPVDR